MQSIRQQQSTKCRAHTAFSHNFCNVNEAMRPSIREILKENNMAAKYKKFQEKTIDRTKYATY
jgi:hypothetical protein